MNFSNRFRTLAVVMMMAVGSLKASAQWMPGTNLKRSLALTLAKGHYLSTQSNFGYMGGVCFVGAFLQPSTQAGLTVTLNAGTEYAFVGGGGSTAIDVDIRVANSSGTILASDVQSDANPVVTFTPSYTGSYTIYLRLYSSRQGYGSFCSMALMKYGGYTIPVARLDEALNRITALGSNLNERVSSDTRLNDQQGQWCFWGGVVNSGEDLSISNLNLGYGRQAIVAAGDSNVSDADLLLTASGERAEDDKTDATPVIIHRTSGSKYYALRIKNHSSYGRAVLMASILTL